MTAAVLHTRSGSLTRARSASRARAEGACSAALSAAGESDQATALSSGVPVRFRGAAFDERARTGERGEDGRVDGRHQIDRGSRPRSSEARAAASLVCRALSRCWSRCALSSP